MHTPAVDETSRPCPCCDGAASRPAFVAPALRLGVAGEAPCGSHAYRRCEACTAVYIETLPTAAELARYYESPDYHVVLPGEVRERGGAGAWARDLLSPGRGPSRGSPRGPVRATSTGAAVPASVPYVWSALEVLDHRLGLRVPMQRKIWLSALAFPLTFWPSALAAALGGGAVARQYWIRLATGSDPGI